jgi:hypothetical protein
MQHISIAIANARVYLARPLQVFQETQALHFSCELAALSQMFEQRKVIEKESQSREYCEVFKAFAL